MARLANSGLNPTTLRAAVTLVLVLAFAGDSTMTRFFDIYKQRLLLERWVFILKNNRL